MFVSNDYLDVVIVILVGWVTFAAAIVLALVVLSYLLGDDAINDLVWRYDADLPASDPEQDVYDWRREGVL